MTEEGEINIFRSLEFINNNAPVYAKAKAERVYLEEFRKAKKALLMQSAEASGHKSAAAQEREAYADDEYAQLLDGLRQAVEVEETLRWRMVAAQAAIEVWRTKESTRRAEARAL